MKVCISSGHSTKCQGAIGIMNEVEEATLVADEVKIMFCDRGIDAEVFHDTVSTSQNENLNRIVDWHNSKVRDLDISIHFNASDSHEGHGVEVLYLTQEDLAVRMSAAIADVSSFYDRGAKYRNDLFVLNHTSAPCVLAEICFLDHEKDVELYRTYFPLICEAIVDAVAGEYEEAELSPQEGVLFRARGKCSYFGGPDDMGVSASEGLAFHFDINHDNQHLFLPLVPDGTTGLARRLNSRAVNYVACRWNYDVTSKDMLGDSSYRALVINIATGASLMAWPADWGPHQDTDRVADLSPALMTDLGLSTDDEVEVIYPWEG